MESGVALSGDHVIASGGSSWAVLDSEHRSEALRGHGRPGELHARAPAVGSDGTIYVQSNVNLFAISPDGHTRWTWPLVGQAESPEPVKGLFGPTIAGSPAEVLIWSPGHQTAVNGMPSKSGCRRPTEPMGGRTLGCRLRR